MYHNWLDRWDERRARRGEEGKETTDFVLDAERAFPGAKTAETIEGFCVLADQAMAKADEAMSGGPTSKSADPYFRDLGVLAYLEATGRPAPDADRLRQEAISAIQGVEGQTALNFVGEEQRCIVRIRGGVNHHWRALRRGHESDLETRCRASHTAS